MKQINKIFLSLFVVAPMLFACGKKQQSSEQPVSSEESSEPAHVHTPDEKGICTECHEFVGKTIETLTAPTDPDQQDKKAPLAYLTEYNVYGEGIDWYKFTIVEEDTKFYVGGDFIATRHTLGLWAPDGTKIAEKGYAQTFEDPEPGDYILKVTKSDEGIREDGALWIKVTK